MSARAGNSIRNSRSPAASTARRDVGAAGQRDLNTAAADDLGGAQTYTPHRSQPLPSEPAPRPPFSAVHRRPTSHSRNIPFHSRSARTVLPPAVLPRPQHGASQPPTSQQPQQQLFAGGPLRANSHNVTSHPQQRPSPRQASTQTTTNSSNHTSASDVVVPSSAPVSYALPRDRGVYPAAPRGVARSSPSLHRVHADGSHDNSNELSSRYSNNTSAVRGSGSRQESSRGSPSRPPQPSSEVNGRAPPPTPPPPQRQPWPRAQPSPPRVHGRPGGVYVELMDSIPSANAYAPPRPPPQQQLQLQGRQDSPAQRYSSSPPAASTALALRPSPRPGYNRGRSGEDSQDRGTSTDDLDAYAYAYAAPPRHTQQQQQYNPVNYQAEVPAQFHGVTHYNPPQHQQQQPARPANYYALAPSLRLAQHRHVRRIVAGEVDRVPPQWRYQILLQQHGRVEEEDASYEAPPPRNDERRPPHSQQYRLPPPPPPQQQYQQQLPPPRQMHNAAQRLNLDNSASVLSNASSTPSSRTRQVFRHRQRQQQQQQRQQRQQPFMTGALPAGSPYGATPTYTVVMPRTRRVPAGLYAPFTLPPPPRRQQSHQQHQQSGLPPPPQLGEAEEDMGEAVTEVEPTVEEPYLVLDEAGGRVVEYEPELPRQQQQQRQQQKHAERPASPVRDAAPVVPVAASNAPPRAPMVRHVVHYYPHPQHQQQQSPPQNAYNVLTPSEETYEGSLDSHDDDAGAATLPANAVAPQRRPPPPPPPLQKQQQSPKAPKDRLHDRTPSGGSQQAPPPTLPPPRPLRSDDSFKPPQLEDGEGVRREHLPSTTEDRPYRLYPTRQEAHAGVDGPLPPPPAQAISEHPSSATLAAPLQPSYRPDGRALMLVQELQSDRLLADGEGEEEKATRKEEEAPPRAAHPPRQRHRGSPPAGRRPRGQQSSPLAKQQQQQQQPEPPLPPPSPPPTPPAPAPADTKHEEKAEEQPHEQHSIVKDSNGSPSPDIDSTVDPEDLMAQQEAKKLAEELVRRSLLPPTPYVPAQPLNAPASFIADSEAEDSGDFATQIQHLRHNAINATNVAVQGGGRNVHAAESPPPVVGGAMHTEDAATPSAREETTAPQQHADRRRDSAQESKEVVAEPIMAYRDSATSSSDDDAEEEEEDAVATAHASPMSADSAAAHSVHVARGKEAPTEDAPARQDSFEGLSPSSPEKTPAAADDNNSEEGNNSLRGPRGESRSDATKEEDDVDANPPCDGDADDHQQQQPAVEELSIHEQQQRQVAEGESAEEPSAAAAVAVNEEGEADVGLSPLEMGELYGYVDPLEEAAMDAAYMLDTLEYQYVTVNEVTGEEMEDLVHVVELNRYNRVGEPRYFEPKGLFSDVLPLLRYPTVTSDEAAASDENGAATALTYMPLTEAAYQNLCAVIWLSRLHSEDAARLLAVAQGPSPPRATHSGNADADADADLFCFTSACPTYYFDHPSANLLEQLDSLVAQHVQSATDDACAQSRESLPTVCARLADRNNLSCLPPAVWQQRQQQQQQQSSSTQLNIASFADHVTEVLLTATVPQEAARRQAVRRRATSEAELHAQQTWSLFLGALPWNYDEAVEVETLPAMPTAAARLSYAFAYKARIRNLEGGLGALTFSALSAQVPDAAVVDSLLMLEKLRLALLYSYKNVAACCALRQRAVKEQGVATSSSARRNSQADGHVGSHNNAEWNSPVFSAYLHLWEDSRNTEAALVAAEGGAANGGGGGDDDDDVVDLYSVAVQLNCFFPTKTERGINQLCAAIIEDLIAMDAVLVPEEVHTPEGAVLTDRTAIVDALVVEGAQAMRHIITTLSELSYTSAVSTDDYVDGGGHVDVAAVRAAMESYLVLLDPGVMFFLSSPVPVDDLFRYVRCDGPPSMLPHTLGRKSTFVEVVRLQHLAETIQYAMEMQDAILIASQYNHLVAVHRKRVQQQRHNTRATPRSLAEELQMDGVVVRQSMDLILNAAPLLPRDPHPTDASLLAELADGNDAAGTRPAQHPAGDDEEDEDVMLGQEAEAEGKGEEVLLRAILIALCCADPTKPVNEVQEYLRHLLVLYAEVRDAHNRPIESTDPLQVAHVRAAAAELTMVDWFGQTAADGTRLPGTAPARCDEVRVNAEELAALCPRVLGRRVGPASTAVADAAAVISASAVALAKDAARHDSEDSVVMANTTSRPPLAQ
ncbi:hypothetical protein ABB37_08461 [Leptomonas pyrrhocoris]|uniref:Uncharacterized protein n=1 Tax=Leptomonas pyrrhocoris TaxID=157538 RepID=A0A0M9FTF0_LEPPY|nr:hypothetical protein ABB37_08461 [Leptomonas pyrrhocoris]KPA75579.1 hypothetical protein ABB37_08461 [Leptomonas pyrrhocoris]|eukprot:XP_015654018.1 hypothetical protein ABB37_08461 [Leptomonas pyrrhocoris]